jgi:hypothetical protein
VALSELIRKLTVVDDIRRVKEVANLLIDGKHAAHGTVTLDVNPATTTTVTDPRVSINSRISLQAITEDGAADVASIWVSSVTNGSFVINHPADSTTLGAELVEDGDMANGNFNDWTKGGTDSTNVTMGSGVCHCTAADDGYAAGIYQTETLAATTKYCYSFEVSNYNRDGGAESADGSVQVGDLTDGGKTITVNANGTYSGDWTTVAGGADVNFLIAILGPGGVPGSTMDVDNVSVKSCSGGETRTFHYIIAG